MQIFLIKYFLLCELHIGVFQTTPQQKMNID